jgi:hypothetical protein
LLIGAKKTDDLSRLSACPCYPPALGEAKGAAAAAPENHEQKERTMTSTPTDKPPFRVPAQLFDLGQIVTTPGAKDACSPEYMWECIKRHVRGDWGCVSASDRKSNFQALFACLRILSAYPVDPAKPCKGFGENTLWIITEGDRSATTFLLPREY